MAGRNLFAEEPVTKGRNLFAEQPGEVLSNAQSVTPEKREIYREAKKRKLIQPAQSEIDLRQSAVDETIQDMWPTTAFAISVGKGVENVARGIGMVGEPSQQSQQGMAALEKEFPIATTAGEITGEAAPFLLPGAKIGQMGAMSARVVGGGLLGAAEGGILAEDTAKGAGIGGAIGAGVEVLFPVIGRLGRSIFRKIKGKEPVGALLDNAGQPTPEFKQVLDESGIDFEELTEDATQMISAQAGRDPQQVATATRFKEAGIPITKGELTKDTAQRTRENQLFETGQEGSEQLREFKLKQSQAIRSYLDDAFGADVAASETGELIQNALTGRRKLLRTQKNELYEQAAQGAKDVGGIPIFTDNLMDALPDQLTMDRLAILDESGVKQLHGWLSRFGVMEPTQQMLDAGFKPEILTLENFDNFRVGLNQIARSSDAIKNATGPITRALDLELDDVDGILAKVQSGGPKNKLIMDEHLDAAFSQMDDELASGDVSRSFQNADGVDSGAASSNPEWFKQKTIDAYNKKYSTSLKLSKKETRNILERVRAGKSITLRQASMYDYLREVAETKMSKDPVLIAGDEFGNLEKQGFEFDAPKSVAVGDLVEGDEIVIMGKNDIPDKLTHMGRNESGDIVLEGGSNMYVDDFDTIDVIAQKTGTSVQAQKSSFTPDIDKTEKIKEVRDSLKGARSTVRQMKTEFSPQSMVGRLIDMKRDGVTPITEATQVYSKLSARSMPIENVNRVMNSLKKSPNGEEAVAALQTSTLMDLIDAGFGTESRQIEGIRTFNPTAFKKRLKAIGEDKVASIFADNKEAFRKIRNIDKISSDLIPPATTVPKGSASVNIQIAQSLGMMAASAKIPVVGPMMAGAVQKIAQPVKVGMDVRKAINAEPDVLKFATMLDDFPNLSRAFGISTTAQEDNE